MSTFFITFTNVFLFLE